MANKTIPQLPLQTGITDNDLLAIVDSGETTTSKIKLSTLLSGVGGGAFQVGDATDSIVPGYSPTSRGVTANTTYVDKLNVNLSNILDIDNGTANNSIIIGGYGTRGTNTGGLGSAVVGGRNPQLAGNANFSAGQFGSSIAGENNGMVGGRGNVIGGGEYNFMGGGRSVNVTAFYSGALGGNGNTVTGNYSTILGGASNTNSGTWSSMLATDSSNINGGQRNMIASCHNSDINGAPRFSTIMGGWGHTISTGTDRDSLMILGGEDNIINNTGGESDYCTIMQGSDQIISNATNSIIAGGTNNTITGGTNVIMLGCSARTANSDSTTYVETLEAFDGIVMTDYGNLDFANDGAAATGGVPLGGMYHNNGDMKIRIT